MAVTVIVREVLPGVIVDTTMGHFQAADESIFETFACKNVFVKPTDRHLATRASRSLLDPNIAQSATGDVYPSRRWFAA